MTIILGYLLDLLIGDPFSFHPVRLIGNLISFLDKKLNNDTRRNGLILLLLVSILSFGIPWFILFICYKIHPVLSIAIEVIMIYQIFATKSLDVETRKVLTALLKDDLEDARKWIGYLVSRDTDVMTKEDIIKATVETISENITDGIVAPLFFVVIGGAPLGWFYKSVNTLDSMVGYKNEKYSNFGFYSAKFDDVLNYIPARLASFLILLSGVLLRLDIKNGLSVLKRDKRNHSSPNSAYSEAAVAGLLRIQLGGKASYFKKVSMKPTMGDPLKEIEPLDIKLCTRVMYVTSGLGLIILTVLKWIIGGIL